MKKLAKIARKCNWKIVNIWCKVSRKLWENRDQMLGVVRRKYLESFGKFWAKSTEISKIGYQGLEKFQGTFKRVFMKILEGAVKTLKNFKWKLSRLWVMFHGNLNKICGSDLNFRKIWEIWSKFWAKLIEILMKF